MLHPSAFGAKITNCKISTRYNIAKYKRIKNKDTTFVINNVFYIYQKTIILKKKCFYNL